MNCPANEDLCSFILSPYPSAPLCASAIRLFGRGASLLLSGAAERLTDVLAAQLDAEGALHLAEDLHVGNGLAALVLADDLGLFVDLRTKVRAVSVPWGLSI